jgi:CRISPR-associated protein Csb2
MALAAAWFETDKDESEGDALVWLENLNYPSICASEAHSRFRHGDKGQRPTTSFVPVNDAKTGRNVPDICDLNKLKKAGLDVLPEFRSRQERAFPLVVPTIDTVHLIWNTEKKDHLASLNSLCRKVFSIGHSSSFVQMWVDENPPEPNLNPVRGLARHRLRVTGSGRLKYLENRYNRDAVLEYASLCGEIRKTKEEKKQKLQEELKKRLDDNPPSSQRPEPGLWQGYDTPRPPIISEIPGSLFDPRLIVLVLFRKRYPLNFTLKLTETVRGMIMSSCPIQPPPEWISGHAPEGGRSEKPHLAIIPMPFVDAEHADGRIMGVSLILPRELDSEQVNACLEPILRDEYGSVRRIRLFDGQWLECEAEIETREQFPFNLDPIAWTRPARTWASVTPVVFDRHFDGPDKWEKAASVVKDGCERIGLPRPSDVILQPVSLVEGVPHSREFDCFYRKNGKGRMHHTHAVLIFDQAICGPVIVGAGRYRGYGLFRPLTGAEGRNG